MLPVSKPSIGAEEHIKIKDVLHSGWLGQGADVMEFENRLSHYFGTRHVIAVSSGTAALQLAIEALGIGAGDEVIVPSLTFCGTIQAITANRAIPVFCDVEGSTLNVDVADVKRRITCHTRAIIPVHYCGNACDMDSILHLAHEYGIRVVEDAAHAFGSSWRGRLVGSFGDITCFSFDPIKNITCGEGGAIVLADEGIAGRLRLKRMVGLDIDGWQRNCTSDFLGYAVREQGYRYHMSNLNAAIGLAQLEKLNHFRNRKQAIVQRYNDAFSSIESITLIEWNLKETFPFVYVVRVCADLRDSLRRFLRGRGVGTGIHYIPNHLQPYFAKYALPLPRTEQLAREILTLPLYSDMSEDDVERVTDAVLGFFGQTASISSAPSMRRESECQSL